MQRLRGYPSHSDSGDHHPQPGGKKEGRRRLKFKLVYSMLFILLVLVLTKIMSLLLFYSFYLF